MRIASAGHAAFAALLIAVGIAFLVYGDFGGIWDVLPKGFPARAELVYLCAAVSLACGAGLFLRKTAVIAARVLLIYSLLWMLAFRGHDIVLAPTAEGVYQEWGQNAVIVAGAWVLYAWFATDRDRRWLGFATGRRGMLIARALYGLAMLAFGLSHFFYLNLTTPLIPGWLPWHVGWAWFFGATYLAAGLAVLTGVYARLAAALSAAQMGLFTLLVWVPTVAAGPATAGQWSELVVSLALTFGGWVVADSYRGQPWLIGKSLRQPAGDGAADSPAMVRRAQVRQASRGP